MGANWFNYLHKQYGYAFNAARFKLQLSKYTASPAVITETDQNTNNWWPAE